MEILILIARITLIILEGTAAKNATENAAKEYDMNASRH